MTRTNDAHHHVFETAFGACGVAWNSRGLCAVQLPERTAAPTERRLAAKAGSSDAASRRRGWRR